MLFHIVGLSNFGELQHQGVELILLLVVQILKKVQMLNR